MATETERRFVHSFLIEIIVKRATFGTNADIKYLGFSVTSVKIFRDSIYI